MANMRNRRMDDPDGVNSRIFVGNIPLDTDRETLKKKFETHGQVNGVMVLKGFAFLQFDKDIHARQAIEKENGSTLEQIIEQEIENIAFVFRIRRTLVLKCKRERQEESG